MWRRHDQGFVKKTAKAVVYLFLQQVAPMSSRVFWVHQFIICAKRDATAQLCGTATTQKIHDFFVMSHTFLDLFSQLTTAHEKKPSANVSSLKMRRLCPWQLLVGERRAGWMMKLRSVEETCVEFHPRV